MARRRDVCVSVPSYYDDLHQATARFLPHQGLPLLSSDGRVRWSPRLLVMHAIFMAWSAGSTLKDRFEEARQALVGIYPTRRRPGQTHAGFSKAMLKHGVILLAIMADHWRGCLRRVAAQCWTVGGWALFGVDGSKFDSPRTAANEKGLGVSGKNNSGPQQLVTCLFHVGSGVLWGWKRSGLKGSSERGHLLEMIQWLPANAMLLADAGFTGYDLLKALLAHGNSFLIRVGANVRLLQELGYAVHEYKDTVYLWPHRQQRRNRKGRLPKGVKGVHPPLVLRLIRLKDAKGRPVCLLTNVHQKRQLSDTMAAQMYGLRWGVEVIWRSLKQTMGQYKILAGAPQRAGVELDWAMAGLWLLQMIAVNRMIESGQLPHRYSVAGSLRVLRKAMTGKRPRRRSLAMELTTAVKDQYVRHGPKAARHFPKKRPQRPPGQPHARMATREEKALAQALLNQPPPNSIAA